MIFQHLLPEGTEQKIKTSEPCHQVDLPSDSHLDFKNVRKNPRVFFLAQLCLATLSGSLTLTV